MEVPGKLMEDARAEVSERNPTPEVTLQWILIRKRGNPWLGGTPL